MYHKATQINLIHKLPAGIMVDDSRTELFGDRESKKVFAISSGVTIPFSEIDDSKKTQLLNAFLEDRQAVDDLSSLPIEQALEQFCFCVFGDANSDPDFDENGKLMQGDNFLCGDNCTCLSWKSKIISVDGKKVTPKQIKILGMLATDMPDKKIADDLGISDSTLDTHKAKLFKKFSVHSKTGLITKAIKHKIIQ